MMDESAIHSLVFHHGVDLYEELSVLIGYNIEDEGEFDLSESLNALRDYCDQFVLDESKVEPIEADTEIKEALKRFMERNQVKVVAEFKKQGKIISVMGSKGGLGTTTIAVNLAIALSDLKKDDTIALIDLNFAFGEIPLFLDISPHFLHHLAHIFLKIILFLRLKFSNIIYLKFHFRYHSHRKLSLLLLFRRS
jgi:hypothetical protein